MAPESRIGTQIAGYRIEALIGQGGMGEVYLAEHETLGRMEAVKVLTGDLSTDEGFRKRFQREARLAASLRHPNIIPVYSAGESNGSLYLVMPYIRGTDLRRLIDERKQLDPEQTLRILDGIASALDAAHGEGLVHRDVKPANILIEARDGHVYLTDFGVTRHMDSKTQLTPTGRFMGTLHYVAPEQIEGKSVDARTDVYSLGCVLYECLVGVVPYQRESEGSLLWAHLSEAPPRLTDRRPDLPRAIDLVIARAMAKRKEDRYDTCTELIQAAHAALGETGEAPRPAAVAPSGPVTLEGDVRAGAGAGAAAASADPMSVTPAAAASLPTEMGDSGSGETVAGPTDGRGVVSPAASAGGALLEEPRAVGEPTGQAPAVITAPTGAGPAAAAGAGTGGAELATEVGPSAELETAVRPSETAAPTPSKPATEETAAAAPAALATAPGSGPAAGEQTLLESLAHGMAVAPTPAETLAAAPAPPAAPLPTAPPPAPPGTVGMPPTMAEHVATYQPPPTIAEGIPPGAPPRKPRRGAFVAVIVGLVVVIGAAVGIVLATSGGKPSTTPTTTPSVPTTLPTTPTPTTGPTVSPTGTTSKPPGGPSAPTGVRAAAAGQTQITLTWSRVSGAAKYLIFVFQAPKPFDRTTATHYTVTGLAPDTKHCYQVVAVGPAGGTSGRSGRSCATTKPEPTTAPPSSQPPSSQPSSQPPTAQPPSTPTGVSVSCSSPTTCTVHWNASSGATSYTVSGEGKSASTSGTSVTFSGLPPGQSSYCFTVVAHNSAGSSGGATGCGS